MTGAAARLVRTFTARLLADRFILALIAVYSVGGVALMTSTGAEDAIAYKPYLDKWITLFLYMFPFCAIMFDSLNVIHRFDTRRKLAFSRAFSSRRMGHLLAGTVMAMSLYFFQGTFTSIKNSMFLWNGSFHYDEVHAAIDNWLHFGNDPWLLVKPLVANDTLRGITEASYNMVYFTLCFSILYFVMTSPKADKLRTHYVACFMLSWIIVGNVLAGLFLSAGPAYYGHITGDEGRFAELLAYLQQGVDGRHSAADYQQYLWIHHESGTPGLGTGISAFPSVHVALISLNAFFAFEVGRKVGIAMAIYAAYILASSVALGWHYAIDGYVSVIVVAALYYGLKPFLRRDAFVTKHAPAAAKESRGATTPVTA